LTSFCGRAQLSDHLVHERIICHGKVARTRGPLEHQPVRKLEDARRAWIERRNSR
jgi:hypothetical protein